jgi:2,6-dihydroxypyridine 3-monooxygenase
MTDRSGVRRPISLPPGAVQASFVDRIHAVGATLPGPLADIVTRTREPFVQAIVDVESPRMAFGRLCLIGDAAFAARPHAAAGSAKAADDARALGEAFADTSRGVAETLERWEPERLEVGSNLVARTRDVGNRSQVEGTYRPGDPSLRFGLLGPGR